MNKDVKNDAVEEDGISNRNLNECKSLNISNKWKFMETIKFIQSVTLNIVVESLNCGGQESSLS